MPRRLLTLLAAALAAMVLASCRLDVAVHLRLDAAGAGALTVAATADADVLARAPGLAEDLRFDDATAAGWTLEGPTPTEDGGLTVRLTHPVSSAEEASNLLASLGPPFDAVAVQRTVSPDDDRDVTTTLTGQLQLIGGFEAFADADLLTAVGTPPFAEELAASGANPAESMSVRLEAELPGEVDETTGSSEDGRLVWDAPLDGSALDVATRTGQRPSEGSSWAKPVAWLALILLVVWVLVTAVALASIVRARRRREARREAVLARRWPTD